MEKKKILYLITQSEWGGAQKYVFDLAKNVRDDFDVTVAFGGKGRLKSLLDTENIRNIILPSLVREISLWKDFRSFREIHRLIKKEKPDLVHTNSSKAEILGNLASWLCRVPVVFTAHGFVFLGYNGRLGGLKARIYVLLERLVNLKTKKIICVSEYDRQGAIKNKILDTNKLVTIHNGLSSDEIAALDSNRTLRENDGKMIIGTIANLYKKKGIEYLIRAPALINKNYNDVEFWVLGEGQERPHLEELISKFQLKNFKLLGFQKDPKSFLKQFNIFVLPSMKEGLPYVILEAMAAGLPIVATKVAGIPEAVTDGENGFLVPPADSQALAEKISELKEDSAKRIRMSQKNREKVQQLFSLETMLRKTKQVYDQK